MSDSALRWMIIQMGLMARASVIACPCVFVFGIDDDGVAYRFSGGGAIGWRWPAKPQAANQSRPQP